MFTNLLSSLIQRNRDNNFEVLAARLSLSQYNDYLCLKSDFVR